MGEESLNQAKHMKLIEALSSEWLPEFLKKDGANDIVGIQSPSGERQLLCLADSRMISHIPEELKQWEIVAEIKSDEQLNAWNSTHQQ